MFEVNIIHANGSKECLGNMEARYVTYNRYNEGLLIGAGKLRNTSVQKEMFLKHATKYRNKAELEFKGQDIMYQGTFCFINFLPETGTVVFGSVGPVYEWAPGQSRTLRIAGIGKNPPPAASPA